MDTEEYNNSNYEDKHSNAPKELYLMMIFLRKYPIQELIIRQIMQKKGESTILKMGNIFYEYFIAGEICSN